MPADKHVHFHHLIHRLVYYVRFSTLIVNTRPNLVGRKSRKQVVANGDWLESVGLRPIL